MCIGIPMQVLEVVASRALCQSTDAQRWIDIRLIETPAPGDWLLVFLDAARESLSAERAAQIQDALKALQAIQQGDVAALRACFADLEREPQLPPHLRPPSATGEPS